MFFGPISKIEKRGQKTGPPNNWSKNGPLFWPLISILVIWLQKRPNTLYETLRFGIHPVGTSKKGSKSGPKMDPLNRNRWVIPCQNPWNPGFHEIQDPRIQDTPKSRILAKIRVFRGFRTFHQKWPFWPKWPKTIKNGHYKWQNDQNSQKTRKMHAFGGNPTNYSVNLGSWILESMVFLDSGKPQKPGFWPISWILGVFGHFTKNGHFGQNGQKPSRMVTTNDKMTKIAKKHEKCMLLVETRPTTQ